MEKNFTKIKHYLNKSQLFTDQDCVPLSRNIKMINKYIKGRLEEKFGLLSQFKFYNNNLNPGTTMINQNKRNHKKISINFI